MLEELQAIDMSTIEELQRLHEEQSLLRGRLESMETRREEVSVEVWERVRADYAGSLAALEEEARPLRERAQEEYLRMLEVHRRLQESQAEARLAKEEVEFRRELGEYDDEQFATFSAEAAERLEERTRELAESEDLRQRFVEAFGSEEELSAMAAEPTAETREDEPVAEAEPDPEVEMESAPIPGPDEPSGELASVSAALRDPEALAAEAVEAPSDASFAALTEEPPAYGDESGESSVPDEDHWRTAATGLYEPEAMPEPPPAPPEVEEEGDEIGEIDESTEATRILAKPRLVTLEGGEPGSAFVLGAEVVTIGRAADSMIQLMEEAVSRRHAEVIPGPDGYVLRDCGSENGTFVNGRRKKEHLLVQGDIIQVGIRKLAFHEA